MTSCKVCSDLLMQHVCFCSDGYVTSMRQVFFDLFFTLSFKSFRTHKQLEEEHAQCRSSIRHDARENLGVHRTIGSSNLINYLLDN